MAEENTSTSSGSATQTHDAGATPTTPASSATLQANKPVLTLEEVLQRNAELEHSTRNAREQADRQARQLEKYQKAEKEAEAAKKAADDAQLSEIERIKKLHAEAEARIKQQQQQLVIAQVKLLAKEKGIINPELIAPVVERKLEYDKDGEPTNLEKVLDDLIKHNPYLIPAPPATPPVTPATATPNMPPAPTLPAMSPGRSSIASPNALPPGKTTLNDIKWSRQ